MLTSYFLGQQEDAAKVVSYCKYPPVGVRGYGPMFTPHSFPGVKPAEYDEKTHNEVMVIVQIESRPGVENVEEIAKVEGLDVLFIGEIGYFVFYLGS